MNLISIFYTVPLWFRVIIALWWCRILIDLASYAQRWYIKEYRFDRMLIYLRENFIKHIFFPPPKRLRIAPKTLGIFALSTIGALGVFAAIKLPLLYRMIVVDLVSFPLSIISVIILKIPTELYHRVLIWRARRKIGTFKNLKVIGVTGSFGKTSTKEFIKIILNEKYKVLATEKSKNTPIGISELILKKLDHTYEVFVVEMGAYKIGEIAQMCKIVSPQIGVITGINEQHIELFGSLAKTRKAKYELIESLPPTGIAIFNDDNEYTRLMAKQTKNKKVITYGTRADAQVKLREVTQKPKKLNFTCEFDKQKLKVTVPLLGKQFAQNIAAAIVVGWQLKLSQESISKGISRIAASDTGIIEIGEFEGVRYIDNSFNANPDSVKAAIEYLSVCNVKKYLILTPLIELGKHAGAIHEELGKYIGNVCDGVITTNSHYAKELERGFKKTNPRGFIETASGKKALRVLKTQVSAGDTVYFCGKETTGIIRAINRK